ncbi:hypothetical protein [Nonomuraea rubra]|uniref:hypothetical protein n=1 Tax=Nonomuraea rubra TaxID=46180 RepID=UPI0031EE6B03
MPWAESLRTTSKTTCRSPSASEAVGSSITTSSAPVASAWRTATICRSPMASPATSASGSMA